MEAIGSPDKHLTDMITDSSSASAACKTFAQKHRKVASIIDEWSEGQTPDLAQPLQTQSKIDAEVGELISGYGQKNENFRAHLKAMMQRTKAMHESRGKQMEMIKRQRQYASKGSVEKAQAAALELETMEVGMTKQEATFATAVRASIKAAKAAQYDALIELGGKLQILGIYGKLTLDVMSDDRVPEGNHKQGLPWSVECEQYLKQIEEDIQIALDHWQAPDLDADRDGLFQAVIPPELPSKDVVLETVGLGVSS